ncbi:hypothetical protein TcWFU_004791 [Taenia crassiceps]|uniref:Uncharacterized protein n=1 Tax=Taenia crassiceps TaxID=6207 RepID=A0ABR4QB12_9CEST
MTLKRRDARVRQFLVPKAEVLPMRAGRQDGSDPPTARCSRLHASTDGGCFTRSEKVCSSPNLCEQYKSEVKESGFRLTREELCHIQETVSGTALETTATLAFCYGNYRCFHWSSEERKRRLKSTLRQPRGKASDVWVSFADLCVELPPRLSTSFSLGCSSLRPRNPLL